MEPDGLAGDPRRELACDPDRELDSLRIAALFAGGAWTLAGTQTRDRILWRTCGDEGDACRGTVGALRSWHRVGGSECHNGNAARRSRSRSGARGTPPLQSSNRALKIRRLGGLRHGARRHARAFGRYEPAIGPPLGCHGRDRDHDAIGHAYPVAKSSNGVTIALLLVTVRKRWV